MIDTLKKLFLRDLERLEKEIQEFPETNLWSVTGSITNSAGNLALHLAGNLQLFIGNHLGGTGYVRDREAEFSKKTSKEEVLAELSNAKAAVANALDQMNPSQLDETYPLEIMGFPMTNGFFLMHLQGHINYHLGQVNYLRRIL